MRQGRAALIAAVAWLVCGCAAPRNHLYRKSGADFERALVLPLNLVAAMPEELAGRANRVDEALLGYLAERGKAIETIGFADAECRVARERGGVPIAGGEALRSLRGSRAASWRGTCAGITTTRR